MDVSVKKTGGMQTPRVSDYPFWCANNDTSTVEEEAVKAFSLFDINVFRPVQQTL